MHSTFAVPPGKMANVTCVPISPPATSFTVPSPPNATTILAPSTAAAAASPPAVFGPVVGTSRTSPSGASHSATRFTSSGRFRSRPAIGL